MIFRRLEAKEAYVFLGSSRNHQSTDFTPVKLRDTRMRNSKISSRGMPGGLPKFRFAKLGVTLPLNDGDLETGGGRASKRTKAQRATCETAQPAVPSLPRTYFRCLFLPLFFSRASVFNPSIYPFVCFMRARIDEPATRLCKFVPVSRKIDDITSSTTRIVSLVLTSNSVRTCLYARLTVRGFAQLRAPPLRQFDRVRSSKITLKWRAELPSAIYM